MGKSIAISVLVFTLYLLVVILASPFLIAFGEKSTFEELFIIFINIPIPLDTYMGMLSYFLPLILNSLFWAVLVYFIVRCRIKSKDSHENSNSLIDNPEKDDLKE